MKDDGSPQRGALRWGRWLAMGMGALVGAYAAAFSFAVLNDVKNPLIALQLHPGLPQAAAQAAHLRLFEAGQRALDARGKSPPGEFPPSLASGIGLEILPRDEAAIKAHAMTALRSSPLSSSSLRQLAFFEDDLAQRRRLLDLAERITRRDVLATLHRAELNLRENDVEGGLADLDRSLVVSNTVDSAVFPLLLGAVGASEQLADAVRERLSLEPPWSERLMRWAIANPAYLPILSEVLPAFPANSPARAPGFGQQVVDQLASQRQFPAAFAAYRTFENKDPNLATMTGGNYPPIDWKLVDNFDTGARPFGEGQVEVFANPGRSGEFAQVLTNFPPGARRLALRLDETLGSGGVLRFAAVCLSGRTERIVSELEVPLRDGAAVFTFPVPAAGCPFQRLTLGIEGGSEPAGALIRSVSFGQGVAASAP